MIKLINNDFNEALIEIEDESIDLILTDIPYNISKDNGFGGFDKKTNRNRVGIDFGEWDKGFQVKSLSSLVPKLKKGGSIVLFSSFEQFGEIIETFSNLELKDKIIWEKSNPMIRNRERRYVSNIEFCSWFVKGKDWTFNRKNDKYEGCVLRYPTESGGGFKRYHPTQKNLNMFKYLLEIHSNEGDVILDPFMGGGTTGVACKQLNRNFIGLEIDTNYFNVASERIDNC